MTSGYISNPLIFLIDTLIYLYMVVVALRLIMQWAHWEYHNPMVQFIIKLTQVPGKFLRRFIPAAGRWDTATLVLLISVTLIKMIAVGLLAGIMPQGILWLTILLAELFQLFINIFTSCPRFLSISAIQTSIPCLTIEIAKALPRPRPEPVTIATFPFNFSFIPNIRLLTNLHLHKP